MPDAIYTSLDEREIRLLYFTKENADSEHRPVYRIGKVSLDNAPPFVALSYEWGDRDKKDDILVNGQIISVASNLAAAILEVANVFFGFGVSYCYLWADALCINQQDVEERNSQVRIMGSIYSSAALTVCWLPDHHGLDVSVAFDTVKMVHPHIKKAFDDAHRSLGQVAKHMGWIEACPALCTVQEGVDGGGVIGNSAWNSLILLAKHSYWTRTWIVQEVVLSKMVLFLSPGNTLKVHQMRETLWWLYVFFKTLGMGLIDTPEIIDPRLRFHLRLIGQSIDLSNSMRVFSMTEIQRQGLYAEDKLGSTVRWHMAMSVALGQLLSDPRDSVYGVLSVSGLDILPDYKKSTFEVYLEFHLKWLGHWRQSNRSEKKPVKYTYLFDPGLNWSSELWFLALTSKFERRTEGEPSWLLDLSSVATRECILYLGIHPWREVIDDFGPNARTAEIKDKMLFVDGYEVDTIAFVSTNSQNISIESLLGFIADCRGKYSNLTERSTLDILLRLIWWPYRNASSEVLPLAQQDTLVHEAMLMSMFLRFLAALPYKSDPGPKWINMVIGTLTALGVLLDPSPNLDHIIERWVAFLVQSFECLESGKLHPLLEKDEGSPYGNTMGNFIHKFLQSREPDAPPSMTKIQQPASEINKAIREAVGDKSRLAFFATSKGFLGAARIGFRTGDYVCALNGCPPLMVLRKERDNYTNLGPATSIELKEHAFRERSEKAGADMKIERYCIV